MFLASFFYFCKKPLKPLFMHKTLFIFFIFIVIQLPVLSQQNDTISSTVYLEGVDVQGFESSRSIMDIPASDHYLPQSMLLPGPKAALLDGPNTLPGVRIEQRSPGSYRVNMRGNLLRSPFGVRNVKVYWNGIPFTEATGSTPLNWIDPAFMGSLELIKGPTSAIYGAGMSGAMLFSGTRPTATGVALNIEGGSFNYIKTTLEADIVASDQNRQVIKASWQQSEGYRRHTNMDRKALYWQQNYTVDDWNITAQLLYSDLFYQLPGGLTNDQVAEDRRQSRPRAPVQNSSIDLQGLYTGVMVQKQFDDHISNKFSTYIQTENKENPFITNYKLEEKTGWGLREVLTLDYQQHQWQFGGEWLGLVWDNRIYENDSGRIDGLRFDDRIVAHQAFAFAQYRLNTGKWGLEAGTSWQLTRYVIDRQESNTTIPEGTVTYQPGLEWQSRLALSYKFSPRQISYLNISQGYSPPSTEEVRTSNGSINEDLKPEQGISVEVGWRNNWNTRFMVDAAVFHMRQRETIVSKVAEDGTVEFENAGSTQQSGFEMLLLYNFFDQPTSFVQKLDGSLAYTWHYFVFDEYEKEEAGENVSFDGNRLTGTTPHRLSAFIDLQLMNGAFLNLNYQFNDAIPLNDANTVYSEAYHHVVVKGGWKLLSRNNMEWNLYGGINNLLNQEYSLGNDLNAFGNRYFNPAPTINFFAGIHVKFNR
jgi:iron complex outermembrane receptor protein